MNAILFIFACMIMMSFTCTMVGVIAPPYIERIVIIHKVSTQVEATMSSSVHSKLKYSINLIGSKFIVRTQSRTVSKKIYFPDSAYLL